MKILIIQENGRHEANRNYRECFNMQRSLTKLNIDVIVWGLGHDNFKTPFDIIVKDVDVIFLLENYNTGWVPNLSKINKLKIFWSIDSHCVLNEHINTVKNNEINITLNSIESHQQYFKEFSKTFYFPNAYPSDLIYPKTNIDKNIFIGFCGSLLNRKDILDSLSIFNISKDIWVLGDDMVNKINSYEIHFNKTLSNDINYRILETMGCNTMVITNNTENLETFFTNWEDIVIYDDINDLHEKLNYLKNNKNIIKKISNNGFNNVIKNHSYDKRMDDLLNIIKSYG